MLRARLVSRPSQMNAKHIHIFCCLSPDTAGGLLGQNKSVKDHRTQSRGKCFTLDDLYIEVQT